VEEVSPPPPLRKYNNYVQEGKNAKARAAERERVKISGGGLKVWLTFVVSILWCKGECIR
jgi:hypothetical protein